jgi:4-diphosphocytidyl-2-C-methyl-D-erythritol kinase
MGALRALAPAKVNLGLFIGPVRAPDGKHELVSVMESISLADLLTLEHAPAGASEDEVLCPGLDEPPQQNLAAAAMRAFRMQTGWEGPWMRLSIDKRIPVAAGLGGGSADAAAALRLLSHASGLGDQQLLLRIAAQLGADVPAQISPGRWLASGAGEVLVALAPARTPLGLIVLPAAAGLSTAEVYREADRLGLARSAAELAERRLELHSALEHGAPLPPATELLHNDLQRAAMSLCPEIAGALAEARQAGAQLALLSGSGPSVLGLFANGRSPGGALALAELAASSLSERVPAPICACSVDAGFGRVQSVEGPSAAL